MNAAFSLHILPLFAVVAVVMTGNLSAEPILTSWFTQNSTVLARVIQETNSTGGLTTPVTTWPSSGVTNYNTSTPTSQLTPAYADVQQIKYDANYVYINSSGLASYTMGPFLSGNGGLFGFWPISQNYTIQIPLSPASTVPTTKTTHSGGPIGLMVNGVVIYDLGDAFGFVQNPSGSTTGSDVMTMTNTSHPWWRDALAVEVVTFDPGFAHQPGLNGQYHYHAEPKALRYQLGDNMQATYDSTNHTYTYTEDTSNLHHSPIIGWCFDGYPIYGPYGYTSPMDPTSGVSRMRSGFVLRNGQNGTTNINNTGRTTLPKWAAIAEALSTSTTYIGSGTGYSNGDFNLSANLQGPTTSYVSTATTGPPGHQVTTTTSYTLGRYIGDYDYLGDRGQTQGPLPTGAFDLDQYNGRNCVTPEFPGPVGTYAYFVTIDGSGNPAFPYMLGKQYYGTKSGSAMNVTIPGSGVTYFSGGPNTTETWDGIAANSSSGNVTITWNSLEGGTYKVEAKTDLTSATWTTLNPSLPAAVNTTLPAPETVVTQTTYTDSGTTLSNGKRFYRVSRTAIASYTQ